MSNEGRQTQRVAADKIAARYAGQARAVMRRASIASMADSEAISGDEPHSRAFIEIMKEIHNPDFCLGCEWVRLMNPDGLGYCQEHGDIDQRENDPRNHEGDRL